MPIEYPIDLIRKDGAIHRLHDPEEASRYRRSFDEKHRLVVRRHLGDGVVDERFHENDWIARDALGAVVHAHDISEPPRRSWWLKRLQEAQAAAECGLPIPGTGACRGNRGRSYRRTPRHKAARQAAASVRHELLEAGLDSQQIGRLEDPGPIPYEDATWRELDRSWKAHRSTRWK